MDQVRLDVTSRLVSDLDDPNRWEQHLSEPVRGRKVLCAVEVLAGATALVTSLARWGAQRPMVVCQTRGTGPVPTPEQAEILVLPGDEGTTMTDQVRSWMRLADRLSPDVAARVDAYDPGRKGLWWVSPVGLNVAMLGRPALGGRPPAQAALEDKVLLDPLLEAVDAPRVAAEIVGSSYDDLRAATDRVRSGAASVVWAGDASGGVNGAGDFVRWIRTPEHAEDAARFFASRCELVRVSAFLDGVPCSIHGIVLPDGIVVLVPMELSTLRDAGRGRFVYAGMGSSWQPPPRDQQQMRELARDLGTHLRDQRGFRGAFGIDGVLTVDGFRATEVNPRFSGGLSRFAAAAQLELVTVNALLGRDVGRSAARIEKDALELVTASVFINAMGVSTTARTERTETVRVTATETSLEQVGEGEGIGAVTRGPSPLGSFLRLVLDAGVPPAGVRAAGLSVLLYEFADRTWSTGFGPVTMSPDVRADAADAPVEGSPVQGSSAQGSSV